MKRVLSSVMAGFASTFLMSILLSRLDTISSPMRWVVAGLAGVAAFVIAVWLVPQEPSKIKIGTRNIFRKDGEVDVENVDVRTRDEASIEIGSENEMHKGNVVVRDVTINDGGH